MVQAFTSHNFWDGSNTARRFTRKSVVVINFSTHSAAHQIGRGLEINQLEINSPLCRTGLAECNFLDPFAPKYVTSQ